MTEEEVQAVYAEITASAEEACLDNPDVNEDDVYYEIAQSVLATASPEMRKEIRFRLGYDWRE